MEMHCTSQGNSLSMTSDEDKEGIDYRKGVKVDLGFGFVCTGACNCLSI